MATSTIKLGRGLFNTPLTDHVAGTPIRFGWITGDIPSSGAITGHDPLTLLLRILLSTGTTNNYSGSGTNYDAYTYGIGLGIPYQRVDVAGIEAIRDQFDYDTALQMIHMSEAGATGKKFIEKELLRPIGCYLAISNEGVITVKRPKNPEKFHVSAANQTLSFKLPTASTEYDATLNVGVYNRTEFATEVARALNATATSGWECDYGGGTANKLRIRNTGDSWDLIYDSGSDQAWQTLGYNSGVVNTASNTWLEANNTTTVFSGRTLTKNDLWDVRPGVSRDDQVTSVLYQYDFRAGEAKGPGGFYPGPQEIEEGFRRQRWYISAEDVNLGGGLKDKVHVIASKGLFSSDPDSTGVNASTWGMFTEDGCVPSRQNPAAANAGDVDSLTQLLAAMILDRYRQPPMRFRARLKWQHNDLEPGDNIQLTYDIPGVFVDREKNADVVTARTFELVRVNPVYGSHVEVEGLGHRANDTTSVSVTVAGN